MPSSARPGAALPDTDGQTPSPPDGPTVFPFATSPAFRNHAALTPLINDDRAIQQLLGQLLNRRGLTIRQAAKELGVNSESLRQYVVGRRANPSLKWFLRVVQMCGAKVTIEYQGK